MPAKVLITGAGGMLGGAVTAALAARHEVVGWSRSRTGPDLFSVDATRATEVDRFFDGHRPDVCVHLVACADVAVCERDPGLAHELNVRTTENVARACARHAVGLVYTSTEYVFDGTSESGYAEDDTPNPLQIYGRTKLLGEERVREVPGHLTVRLPILYGPPVPGRAHGWVEAMLRALGEGRPVELDDGVERQPTWTGDVARALEQAVSGRMTGVLHVASRERLTKLAWGRRIAEAAGLPASLLRPARPVPDGHGVPRPARPWLLTGRLERHGVDVPADVPHHVKSHVRSLGF
ncbi:MULTISPECIES: SDR family oxidoreductase [unclassified Streptomyces]|uniref:SDR family oxidoreductase n=1 Tax=unclassified Streptomyces TaxID=2593676 RepID=UPI0004C1F626|nr:MULTISPECIES: SDR family oxidoreductase [unclassified Streptomyces]